eukprot:1877170-Rhodomonas_salina.1
MLLNFVPTIGNAVAAVLMPRTGTGWFGLLALIILLSMLCPATGNTTENALAAMGVSGVSTFSYFIDSGCTR